MMAVAASIFLFIAFSRVQDYALVTE